MSLLVEIFCAYTHCTACCFDSERAFTGMYEPADSNSQWERKAIRVRGKKLFALAEKKKWFELAEKKMVRVSGGLVLDFNYPVNN